MTSFFTDAFNTLPPDEREAFYRTVFLHMDTPAAAELRRQYYATRLRHMSANARIGCGVKIENPQRISLGDNVLWSADIGDGAVIGSGSVVVKPIPPFTVAVGVPARVIRKRGEPLAGKEKQS